jgi:hypothetical protein
MSPRVCQGLRANLDVIILATIVLPATRLGVVRAHARYENSRNRLNLGAWRGFQQVLDRNALDLAQLEFRFRVEENGRCHVLYDHRADGFSGVRFSSRPDSPSFHYRAAADGE